MRVSPILTAFNAGELSPQVGGRLDLDKYVMGCEKMENFFCRAHGGAQRRPGSYFLAEVKTSAKWTRLIPFQFNTAQAYMLEFGDQYVRFFMDYSPVTVSGAVYEIASPYLEEDIWDIRFVQDSDIMYLTHPLYPVYKLSRFADDSWTLEAVEFIDGPYLDENDTETTLDPGATTGTGIDLVASADLFEAGHVGAYFRIKYSTAWGYCKIVYVTDARNAVCDIIEDFGAHTATAEWREGAWSDVQGYPSVCAFHEQRLILANSPWNPQTIWASASGDYEDFTPGALDDDPYTYTIVEKEVNAIRWLSQMGQIIVGTSGGEARLGPQDSGTPVTPSSAKVSFQSFFGSAPLPAVATGNAILFWEGRGHPDNYGERLRELSYKFETDSFDGVDLTVMSDHITRGGIVDHALQKYPFNILWCVRWDGTLIGLTYDRSQQVVGWHRHPMDGYVESVAVIPGETQDDLYMVVVRTVGGALKRYIEVLEDYDWGDDQADCFFVDCGMSYIGAEKDITGATKADPVVITSDAHGYSNGDHVKISEVVGMTELNGLEVVVTNKTDDTFECYKTDGTKLNGTAFTTYASGGVSTKMAITLTGLDHLIGETVDVLADGAVHPQVVVTGAGEVVLQWYVCKAHVGIHYESILTTMELEGGSREGVSQAKQKRVHEVAARFYNTLGGKIGTDETSLEQIVFRTSGDLYNNPPPLFTGDKTVSVPADWEDSAKITIVQDQPLPMTALALLPRFRSEDR